MKTKALLLLAAIVAVSCQKHQQSTSIAPGTSAYPMNLVKNMSGTRRWQGYDSMFNYGYVGRIPIFPSFAISVVSDTMIIANNLQYWTPNSAYDTVYLAFSGIDSVNDAITFSCQYNADYGYACVLDYYYKQDSMSYGENYWNYMGESWFTLINTK